MALQTTESSCTANTEQRKNQEPEQTVRMTLDVRIAQCRKHLEELCIQKAKAETAGLLDFPQSVINGLAW